MKRPSPLLWIPFLTLLLGAAAPRIGSLAPERDSKLEECMGELQRTLRPMGAKLEDESTMRDALESICRLQRVALEAKEEVPPMISRLPEEDREPKVDEFRLQMHELIRALLDLEAAVLEGKADEAKKIHRNLNGIKSKGHRVFKPRR